MADNDPGSDPIERALRLFVYGPVGFACYLRDSGPTFLDVFVSRGRREVNGAKRAVEEKLGMSKSEPEPAPSVQQRVTDGLVRMASQAGIVVAAVAGPVVGAATGESGPSGPAPASTAPEEAPAPILGNGAQGAPKNGTRGARDSGGDATSADAADLPIPGYDLLSASQVIERLDGLSRGALDRIRGYELAHRARRTILASIDQLTR